jgi:hypothetical protein
LNKSIKIFIKWFLGPLLAVWLCYSLYRQVKNQPDLETAWAMIKTVPFGAMAWKFWLVIAMVFINWGIEARKWQLLMSPVQPMAFIRAFKSVLCGVTLSLNTPNRIGEYGGRVLFVDEGKRLMAVSLSIAGGIAQLIITVMAGCCGLVFLLFSKEEIVLDMGISFLWLKIFLWGSIFVAIILLLFFFRMRWLVQLAARLPYGDRIAKYVKVLETFDAKILLRLLSLSLCRYMVFILQYIFMLELMQVEKNYWQSFWLVTVLFWLLAIIPSFAIAELGIRGTIAKTLFAFSKNLVGILAVTFSIWFINLFIPALIGSLLILGIKSKKDK